MKHNNTKFSVIYAIFAVLKITVGLLGSSFVFVADGIYALTRSAQTVSLSGSESKISKMCKTVFAGFTVLVSLYSCYYSSLMLLSQISYASVRPDFWVVIPAILAFLVQMFFILDGKDSPEGASDEEIIQAEQFRQKLIYDAVLAVMAVVGVIGTFFLDFYIEYAAALSISLAALKMAFEIFVSKKKTAKQG